MFIYKAITAKSHDNDRKREYFQEKPVKKIFF